ncbi:MAG: AAA family ATPase, partial [Pseudanabaena sp.]
YSLEGLDITAWRQYFHDCENGGDLKALLQMRDAYNGNAKVMDILHGAIKNRFDGNIGAYWNRYKDALLADSELETLISVEMDWLRDNQPDAYKLLCRMGCYRYQDVKTVPFEGLICLLWDVPESRQVWVVDYLSKTSLIEVKGEYNLHPAVRDAAKLRLLKSRIDFELANINAAELFNKIDHIKSYDDALKAFEAYHHYIAVNKYQLAADVIVTEKKSY